MIYVLIFYNTTCFIVYTKIKSRKTIKKFTTTQTMANILSTHFEGSQVTKNHVQS